ncbi:zinc finger protein 813-like isoform X3 [Adelges cooleyi]|uniref:zinc finger protein 813-like isoform X2 n=1 Tax=Adelges cooleyi TaxID=133065 RepID=UPI00217F9110|nr:zinc finger protein 813-like isoform X2 [Adelges cooleyi]XP_050439794.1 zinc finger protein 813-like isoform X3 [Adelges cooleyi]
MDDYNHGTIIKLEENEDEKEQFSEAILEKNEPNHIEKSPTNQNDYQKTIDGDAYRLNEAGGIKIEVRETDDYYYKSIFEVKEEKEQQNTIDANGYNVVDSKIKVEDKTDGYYYGIENKIDKDDEEMKQELTETSIEETKLANAEKSYNSYVTAQKDLQKTFDGNIYNYRKEGNTTIVKLEADIVNGHYFESVIQVEHNGLLNVQSTKDELDEVQQFACNLCKKSFNTKWRLAQHITRLHNAHAPTQKNTRTRVIKKSLVSTDTSYEKNKQIDSCHVGSLVEKDCHNQIAPKNDNNDMKARRIFYCNFCQTSYHTKKQITLHLIKSHKSSFSQKSNRKNHERVHAAEKPYKCLVCLKSFSAKSTLKNHGRVHTGDKPYKCAICLKSFSRKGCLKIHERVHTGEKPYSCAVCLKSFSHKNCLTIHERVHTGEKPYSCTVCLKSFAAKRKLTIHESVHTGEKLNKCLVCLKSFSEKSNLTKHKRVHTGERPYKCAVCFKSFSLNTNLTKHKHVHTGEKPYKCTVCPIAFFRKDHLVNHERLHTGENLYKCAVCFNSFTTKSSLTKHNKRVHTD